MPSLGLAQKDFASWDDLWDIQQQFRVLKESCESQTYEINCANTQVSMLIKKVQDLENKNDELMSFRKDLVAANHAHQSNIEDLACGHCLIFDSSFVSDRVPIGAKGSFSQFGFVLCKR